MLKKRKGYTIIIDPVAKNRIDLDQCPSCSKPKAEWTRRRDWRCCSKECTRLWQKSFIHYGWGEFRIKVFRRDNFTCVECGLVSNQMMSHWTGAEFERIPNMRNYVADHIIPIALGGGEFEMENIQTLCRPCNKIKTKNDAEDIARERRRLKLLQVPYTQSIKWDH